MELLGHDFFLFYNLEASQFNLIYRRSDGNYGLIQPELG
jgi:putative sigma-54 modulation protein